MNVTILTEGGDKIGLGHISRCQSLAYAFTEKNHVCKFIIKNNGSIQFHLKHKHESFDWYNNKSKLLNYIKNTDIMIIDSYNAPEELYYEINNVIKNCVYFDDYNRINYPSGVIINPTSNAQSLNYNEDNDIVYLLGPEYQALQKPFWDVVPRKKNEKPKDVLITFGGDDLRNLTPKVVNILNNEFPLLRKTVVIGASFSNIDQIKKIDRTNIELIYHPNSEKMLNLMLISDLVICGGGQTLYELARLKTPALILGIAKNQEININYWQNFPYYSFAGWWNDIDIIGRLRKELGYFINKFESIANEIYNDKQIIDGQGSRRIVKESIIYVRKS